MLTKIFRIICFLLVAQSIGVFPLQHAVAKQLLQVAGLVDLRTKFSDGEHDLEFLVKLAREREFQVVILSDHDRMVMEYGLFPLRHLLKKRVEKQSVNLLGAQKYLDKISVINKKYPDMLVIPGVEAAPFYYWTGNPFTKGLTAHDWEKHLLVVGLEKAEDFAGLPSLHNGHSTAYTFERLPIALLFLAVVILGLVIVRWNNFRLIGIVVIVLGIAFLFNVPLFSSSPYDQYHGDQGIGPYQLLIDYVNGKGGFTFWNHLETTTGIGKKDIIHVETKPYPEALRESRNYTGFAALYGNRTFVIEPGEEWDKVLLEYCNGVRSKPVWGISTADYHKEGGSGEELGNFSTVFLVKEFTKEAVYSALREGKMYALRGPYSKRAVLEEFSVNDFSQGITSVCGDEVSLSKPATVKIGVGAIDNGAYKTKVRLIRDGKLLKSFSATTPFSVEVEDDYFVKGKKSYYRLDISGDMGRIISNPIFVVWK